MKVFRNSSLGLIFFAMAVFFSFPIAQIVYGGENIGNDKLPVGQCLLKGIVKDTTMDFDTFLSRLEEAVSKKSIEDYHKAFSGNPLSKPASSAIVSLKSKNMSKEIKTDPNGNFELNIPRDDYEISATMSALSDEKIIATAHKFVQSPKTEVVYCSLFLGFNSISLEGRVIDESGNPIPDVRLTAIQVLKEDWDSPEYTPDLWVTKSDADGRFSISKIPGTNFLKLAGYLKGGYEGAIEFIKLTAESSGYIQESSNIVKIPLITENLLQYARRFNKVQDNAMLLFTPDRTLVQGKDGLKFPLSKGDVIYDITVQLKKMNPKSTFAMDKEVL